MSETEPTTAETPQQQQAPTWDVREGVKLSRADGKADLVPVEFPTVPDRARQYRAYRFAAGYREGDGDTPSAAYSHADTTACCWAALGLCWRGPDVGLPSFRDAGRDVVAYGEAVITALYFAGYTDGDEQATAGHELMTEFMKEFFAASRKAQGFSKAKPGR